MNPYLDILKGIYSKKFVAQGLGILLAVTIVATGAYINNKQQDIVFFQREGQTRDPQEIKDPSVVFFSTQNDMYLKTDIVDNSYSFDAFGMNDTLNGVAAETHNRLIMFIDSTDGVTYRGKVNTLEKLALENNTSLLAINYSADGPSNAELFLSPGVSAAFTDQEAAALIQNKVKPALAEFRLEYALILVAQQFTHEITGHNLYLDSSIQRDYSHNISKPGTTKIDNQDTHNLFDGFMVEDQRDATNGISFLVVLCILALFLIWKTPSRYWGFIYGGSIAYAVYQSIHLPTYDAVDLGKPHTIFVPVLIVIVAGASVGYFVDYLISRPAGQRK